MKRLCHPKPVAVHGKRDLGRSTLKIHHRHDDVALREPPAEVAELVVGGKFGRSSVTPRVLLLAYDTSQSRHTMQKLPGNEGQRTSKINKLNALKLHPFT